MASVKAYNNRGGKLRNSKSRMINALSRGFKFSLISFLIGCFGTDIADQSKNSETVNLRRYKNGTVREGYYPVNGAYQKVTFVVSDGKAIVGGDILLDPAKILNALPKTTNSARILGTRENSLWPSRSISYYIEPGFSSTQVAKIQEAMQNLDAMTNLILTRKSSPPSSGGYIRFTPTSGSSQSPVGYQGAYANVVYIGTNPEADYSTVIHEVGHSLGFYHEHQRPDREVYLNMYRRNACDDPDVALIDKRATSNPSACFGGWYANMDVHGVGVGPMDFESIMMYWHGAWHLMNSNGNYLDQPAANSSDAGPDFVLPFRHEGWAYPTMLRKGYDYATDNRAWNWGPALDANNRATLSKQDIATINSFYPVQATKIGWINMGTCSGISGSIFQDDEDVANYTVGHVWNSGGPTTPNYTTQKGVYPVTVPVNHVEGTRIDWCQETIPSLPILRRDYAVLKMSADCPANSFGFSRTSDNENSGNANSFSGTITPSVLYTGGTYQGYTKLQFCFVPGDGALNTAPQPTPPWYSRKAGVFTAGNGAYGGFEGFESGCNYHFHIQDDEDVGNVFAPGGVGGDNYSFEPAAAQFEARIRAIFNGTRSETHYNWHECNY